MRVTIFTTEYTLGGAEKHAFLVADYFKNTLQIPTEFVVVQRGTGQLEGMCKDAGIPTRELGMFKSLAQPQDYFTAKKEAKKLAGFDSDVIMSFNLYANLANAIYGRKAGAKCIVWTQQTTMDCEKLVDYQKDMLRSCDSYISNSQHGADYLHNRFQVEQSKLFVVKNGFQRSSNIKYSPEQWWSRTGVNSKEFKAAMIAHIEERKDHVSLIKAWQLVVEHARKTGREPILYVAGKMGPDTGELHRLAMEMSIYNNIRFLGPINDAQGLYNSVDVCLFYSKLGGMPNSLVEAMLQKLPVVANDIPGNVEALGPLNKDFVSDSKDITDFANKVIQLMDSVELRKQVGERNHNYAVEEYSFEKLGISTFNVINDCLTKATAKPKKQGWL